MAMVAIVQELLATDQLRRQALQTVADLQLRDCWIGAGFVRDAVWDHLHGYAASELKGDVDVVWFCATSPSAEEDARIERELKSAMPSFLWSVKNQARMHCRNSDAPYRSVADAMMHWPETATAVAARMGASGMIEINAPLGLDDLLNLRLRPTSGFRTNKLPIFEERVTSKRWEERYPKLTVERGVSERTRTVR